MAIPIRLSLGAFGDDRIDLLAQSFDISVERNVSAFPTPDNYLKRFAADLNVPRVEMEIAGIFVDDDTEVVGEANAPLSSMVTILNFGKVLPTRVGETRPVVTSPNLGTGGISPYLRLTSRHTIVENETLTVECSPIGANIGNFAPTSKSHHRSYLRVTNSYLIGAVSTISVGPDTKNVGGYISIVDNPAYEADKLVGPGNIMVKSDGTTIGTVSSVTASTIIFTSPIAVALTANDTLYTKMSLFNQRGDKIGIIDEVDIISATEWHVKLLSKNAQPLALYEEVFINEKPTDILHNCEIKIVPSYWIEDCGRNVSGSRMLQDGGFDISDTKGHIGIRFKFDKNYTHSLCGGSSPPVLTKQIDTSVRRIPNGLGGYKEFAYDAEQKDAYVRIPVGDIMNPTNGNPAKTLALIMAEALALTSDITDSVYKQIHPDGDTLPTAFEVSTNGPVIMIKQIYTPETVTTDIECCSTLLKDRFGLSALKIDGTPPSHGTKSAGDKVQDLMGIVSNAHKDTDLIRGIQIPYDSLITSSGVTGIARNFFLTFGELDIAQKGSAANLLPASKKFKELSMQGEMGGGDSGETTEYWFEAMIDGIIPDSVQNLVGFVGSALQDLWVTLDTDAHGNDGGMRVIPEKLHIRYDAGNQHYAFNLKLMASDFVIGV